MDQSATVVLGASGLIAAVTAAAHRFFLTERFVSPTIGLPATGASILTPGAQLRFTDADGIRVTAFITDTGVGVVPGQVAGLELRQREHSRVEDRIRELKPRGRVTCSATAFGPRPPGSKNHPGRRRSGHPAHRIPNRPRLGPLRNSDVPLPGPARGGPHPPTVPVKCGDTSMPSRAGPQRSPPPGNTCAPPSDGTTSYLTNRR